MKSLLLTIMLMSPIFLVSCQDPDVSVLEGKWRAVEIRTDTPERYLPDEMEFFPDRTMSMPGISDKKMPFKTELTQDEKKLIRENYPELQGKNLLLIKLDPQQKDWSQSAVYQYSVTADELSLRPITENTAVIFRRVPDGAGK